VHRAAALRSGTTTDAASDDESNNENAYIIYEYPGFASVQSVPVMIHMYCMCHVGYGEGIPFPSRLKRG